MVVVRRPYAQYSSNPALQLPVFVYTKDTTIATRRKGDCPPAEEVYFLAQLVNGDQTLFQ